MKIKYLLMSACLIALSGCATLFGDKSDPITIHSNNANASLLVNGNEVGRGSATYSVPAGKTAMLTASAHGCSDRTVPTEQKIRDIAWLDILFLPAFIVDLATGAIHETDPKDYTVSPACHA